MPGAVIFDLDGVLLDSEQLWNLAKEEVTRARAYAAGRLVLAFENTNAVARYGANQAIVRHESIDPDAAIAALDAVTFDEVREVAASVADRLAVACVGPHAAEEFALYLLYPMSHG